MDGRGPPRELGSGVAPGAPWEHIRQAYLDLVRVWHPDRFQSDPDLRSRAEQQLQRINEAYRTLESSRIVGGRPEPRRDPEPDGNASTVPVSPPPSRASLLFYALAAGAVCLLPMALAWLLASPLWLADLDSSLIGSRLPRPAIFTPSRIINPFANASITSSAFAVWARGNGFNLWMPLPAMSATLPDRIAEAHGKSAGLRSGNSARSAAGERQRAAAAPFLASENGSEVIWKTQLSGLGELWVTNDTGFDAVATLVPSRGAEPLRAIYIRSGNKVCIGNIGGGVYDLTAEVGEDWDSKALSFRAERHSLARAGPFDFFDVTSVEGSFGCRYDTVLRRR